jgi:hypothetical protein
VFQLNEINSPCLFHITYKRTCQFPFLCTCGRMRRTCGVTDNMTEIKRKQVAVFQANNLPELCWIMWHFRLSPRCISEYYAYGFWRSVKWLKFTSTLKRRWISIRWQHKNLGAPDFSLMDNCQTLGLTFGDFWGAVLLEKGKGYLAVLRFVSK